MCVTWGLTYVTQAIKLPVFKTYLQYLFILSRLKLNRTLKFVLHFLEEDINFEI